MTSSKRFPRLRKALFVVSITLGCIALIAAAALFAADRGWQRQRIVDGLALLASDSLGIPVSAESAPGHLSEGLRLRKVVIGDPADPLAEIESIALRWTLDSIFEDEEWILDEIRAEGLSLSLHRTAEGEWEPIDVLRAALAERSVERDPSAEKTPLRLRVRRMEWAEATLVLSLDRTSDAATNASAEAAAREPIQSRWSIDAEVDELAFASDVEPEPGADAPEVQPLRLGDGRLRARLLELDSATPALDRGAKADLDLRTTGQSLEEIAFDLDALGIQAQLIGEGSIDLLDRIVLHVESSDLSSLNELDLLPENVQGHLVLDATGSGSPNALLGSGQLRTKDFAFGDVTAEQLAIDLDLAEAIDFARMDPQAIDAELEVKAIQVDFGDRLRQWIPAGHSDADVSGRVRNGRLTVRRGEIRHPDLQLDATGEATLEEIAHLDLAFKMKKMAPWVAAWQPDLPLRGDLQGEATLSGRIDQPVGRVVLKSESLAFSKKPIGALELEIERSPGQPANLSLWLGEGDGSGSGSGQDPESAPLEDGRASATPGLRLDARIDVEKERLEFSGATRAETWMPFIEDAPNVSGEVAATGTLARSPGGPLFALELQSEPIRIDGTDIGRVRLAADRSSANALEVSEFGVDGPNGALQLTAPVSVRLSGERWSFEDAAFDFRVPEEPGRPGGLRLRASGRAGNPEAAKAELDGFPVAVLDRLRGDRSQLPLSGRLGGTAEWSRTRAAGWTAGRLEWTEPGVGDARFDRALAQWQGEPNAIDLDLGVFVESETPLSVKGRLELPAKGSQDPRPLADRLSMKADLNDWDLALFDALTPKWMRQLRGRVTGSIDVQQTPAGVELNGQTVIAGGGFAVPILRQRFAPIDGRIVLDGRSLTIESLRVGRESADAVVNGRIAFPIGRQPQLEGQVEFDQFPFARSSAAHLDLLGKANLSGTLQRPKITGELAIANARIGVPASDDPVLKEIRIATRSSDGELIEPGENEENPLGEAEIDVELRVPDSTRVRGQGANLFVEGVVRAEKQPDSETRIRGEARVANGTYIFQGRSFEVRRGRLTLTGGERLDPLIDVEARHPVSDIVAIVELSGRLSAPIVRLTSDPPRPDQDVLSYLLFGRAASEVAAANSSGFSAAAARLVAGVAEKELRDILGDAMPVDSIEIGSDAAGNTSELGFGKFLGPNLFFRYVHVLGDEPSDQVGVEYRINDIFSIGSSVSTTGDAGLDLIFRHDF